MRFSLPIVQKNINTDPIQNLFSKLSTFTYNVVRPAGSFIGNHLNVITKVFIAVAIVGLVGVGSLQSAQTSSRASATNVSGVDELTQKELAVFVADLAGIDSVDQQTVPNTLEQMNYEPQTQNVVKAQIIKADAETRHDIVKHTVKEGETLASIAQQYGVSSETIKWANDMSSNTVALNETLSIPPIDGVVYTVESGDTAKKLADTYNSNAEDIIAFNDAEISGLKEGMKIIIPNGEKPEPVNPIPAQTYYASAGTYNYGSGYASNYTPMGYYKSYGNYYAQYGFYSPNMFDGGQCTWWADVRAGELGNSMAGMRGNATSWDNRAGFIVSKQPKVGAVVQTSDAGYGHVGVVEAVSSDGSKIKYSDMNGMAGFGVAAVTNDWVSVSATNYDYIYNPNFR